MWGTPSPPKKKEELTSEENENEGKPFDYER